MPAELLRQLRVDEALKKLQDQVRAEPAVAKHRVFLFQLLCVMGRWDKALVQLNVAAEMDAGNLLMAQVCRAALECEALRAEVFAGKRQPLLLGEPAEWVGLLIQSNMLLGQGKAKPSADLRQKAMELAPVTSGKIDGNRFEWIADADGRMGPMMEAIIDGRYFWIPFTHIKKIEIEKPEDLRDLVWIPARFIWTNEGEANALIPTRYPGSEKSENPAIQMARLTEWEDGEGELSIGLGQRLFATDQSEYPILETRVIEQD